MKEGLIIELQLAQKFFLNSVSCLTEEDSNFAPKPEMFTVAQQVEHAAHSVDWFVEGAFVRPDGFDMDFEAQDADTRKCQSLKQALEHFDQAFKRVIQTVQETSDEALMTPFPEGPIMAGVPKVAMISSIMDHTAHHRGALTVYARLLGKVPQMPYGE